MSYANFPPADTLKYILHNYPQSALIYLTLYEMFLKNPKIKVHKKDIPFKFYLTKTPFRQRLLQLTRLHLLTFSEKDETFLIDISQQLT